MNETGDDIRTEFIGFIEDMTHDLTDHVILPLLIQKFEELRNEQIGYTDNIFSGLRSMVSDIGVLVEEHKSQMKELHAVNRDFVNNAESFINNSDLAEKVSNLVAAEQKITDLIEKLISIASNLNAEAMGIRESENKLTLGVENLHANLEARVRKLAVEIDDLRSNLIPGFSSRLDDSVKKMGSAIGSKIDMHTKLTVETQTKYKNELMEKMEGVISDKINEAVLPLAHMGERKIKGLERNVESRFSKLTVLVWILFVANLSGLAVLLVIGLFRAFTIVH